MKIAFIGSHGTGKTTLCYELAAHLKRLDLHVDLVKEVARRAPTPLNRQTTLEGQLWILHTQIAEEIAAATRHDVVVCDRSAIDNYAYLVHAFGRVPSLDRLVGEWMESYTKLFWVPIRSAPPYDGVRDTSAAFQHEVDSILGTLIEAFALPVHRLATVGHDEALPEILDALSLPLEPPQIALFEERSPAGSPEEHPRASPDSARDDDPPHG